MSGSNKLFDIVNDVIILGPPVIIEKNSNDKKEIRLNVFNDSWKNCSICGEYKKLKPINGNKKIIIISDYALTETEYHGCYVTYPIKCDIEFNNTIVNKCKGHLYQEIINLNPDFVICVGPLSWLGLTGNYKTRNFEVKNIDTGRAIYCKLESINECYKKVLDRLSE